MLIPKNKILRSYGRCFYGHAFDKHVGLKAQLHTFLEAHKMTIQPEVSPGEWLWEGLTRSMIRSAFCVFETVSENRNVHIELGYALPKRLRVALLVQVSRESDADITRNLPSDLPGLVQVRYDREETVSQELEKRVPRSWLSVTDRLSELICGA